MDFGEFWICYSTINSASNDTIFCFLPFISAFGPFWAFNSRTNSGIVNVANAVMSSISPEKLLVNGGIVEFICEWAKKWLSNKG